MVINKVIRQHKKPNAPFFQVASYKLQVASCRWQITSSGSD